jgi:aminoglycoside phosphotransferase (APT) family kinase protein
MGRVPWQDLPEAVRRWAAEVLGSAVVDAASQPGGFSPGAACRLTLADGSRAFLKAVSASANPDSPDMHRREAAVAAALPAEVPAPALLGSYDDGEWVALLFADVDGRQPGEPWQLPDLGRVISALDGLHQLLTPSPLDGVPAVQEMYSGTLSGWRDLAAAGGGGDLDDWSARNLHSLADLEADWAAAAAGTTLLHSDVRADNVLITADGVVFVDWPGACTGAPWFDVVAFAPSVAMQGGPEPDWVLASSRTGSAADPDAVTAVVAAVAGYFTRQALRPAPPGLPTVRAFQAAQGAHARAWLRRRTGWS